MLITIYYIGYVAKKPVSNINSVNPLYLVIKSIQRYVEERENDDGYLNEGIDVNKSSNSKECSLCHYWHFIDKNFNYGPYLCNGCHDMSMKVVNLKDLAIISVKENFYLVFMSKNDTTKLLKNYNLNNKGVL